MGIKLGDYFKDPFNVFAEEEAIIIFKKAGLDTEEQRLEECADDYEESVKHSAQI